MAIMSDSVVGNLILDLLEWLAKRDRSYDETIDAWRTSCPKLPVWEETNDHGFVALEAAQGSSIVRLTPTGLAFLEQHRPSKTRRVTV
jgi:D-3-phosphoglycerate dehydrogenase